MTTTQVVGRFDIRDDLGAALDLDRAGEQSV